MDVRKVSAVAVCAVFLAGATVGQQTAATDHVTAIKESLQRSLQALHGYTWVETTVISIKGEEKSRSESSCSYSADGQVVKTPIPGQSPDESKKPRGLRGRIAAEKKADITESMQEAIALVKQYVPPDAARIQAAKESGNLSVVPPDDRGDVQLIIKDYLKPGGQVVIEVDGDKNLLRAASITTYVEQAKDESPVSATGATPRWPTARSTRRNRTST